MKVFIINPKLTSYCKDSEDIFYQSLKSELDYYTEYKVITNIHFLDRDREAISKDDLLILFNGKCQKEIDNHLLDFIEYACKLGAYIQPVALKKNYRQPVTSISAKQTYDVEEQLWCRGFSDDYIKVISSIFARNEVIARVNPSIYSKKGMIFISHRRLDGEEITANLCNVLEVQYKNAKHFRDVTEVEVGANAQEDIDIAMNKSDAFIFLHTPGASNSDWIKKELYFAIVRQIPIIWIQIDNALKEELSFLPTEAAHLSFESKEFHDEDRLKEICDIIMKKTFEIIINKNNEIFSNITKIKDFVGINANFIDETNMIYSVEAKRKGYRYHHRDIRHVVQFLGRTVTKEDLIKLSEVADKQGKSNIDSMILLSNKILKADKLEEGVILENYDDFFDTFDNYLNKKTGKNAGKEIVISGAFPDSEEAYKQVLADALVVFAREILKKGYILTFGSHPTFQELFFQISRIVFGESNPDNLKMYISKYFEKSYKDNLEYLNKNAIVYETENHEDGLFKGLTTMRKEMIQRDEVAALICVGGKRKSNPLEEGIREEINLAIEKNIPVFIVGTVGGCSSVVASEYKNEGWEQLNSYGSEFNERLKNSLDYKSLAYETIKKLSEEEVKDN